MHYSLSLHQYTATAKAQYIFFCVPPFSDFLALSHSSGVVLAAVGLYFIFVFTVFFFGSCLKFQSNEARRKSTTRVVFGREIFFGSLFSVKKLFRERCLLSVIAPVDEHCEFQEPKIS
jgi:hypothetical protein